MKDPRLWISTVMADLGQTMLVPSTEAASGSVWVTDDRAPGGVAGYFEKKRVALPHRIAEDGRVVVFDFTMGTRQYRIRCGHEDNATGNLRRVAEVLGTLLEWVNIGIVTFDEAFAGFARESRDEWWRVLRVPPDATIEEIDAGYKRLALRVHPDHGGSHERFLELRRAYEAALASRPDTHPAPG